MINTLFVCISTTDLLLCTITLFSAISAFSYGSPGVFASPVFCNFWGFIWHTGCGFSIFLVAVLAVSRWRSLVYPLRHVRKRLILPITLGYLGVQVFKSTMNYWYVGKGYEFSRLFLGCSVSNINMVKMSAADKVLYALLYVCEVVLPAVPALVFSVATLVSLVKADQNLKNCSKISDVVQIVKRSSLSPRGSHMCRQSSALGARSSTDVVRRKLSWNTKRDATITILILIGVYFGLNIWFWLLTAGDAIYIYTEGGINYSLIWDSHDSFYRTYYVIYIHTVVLNSTINAVIYFRRVKGLKKFGKSLILYICRLGGLRDEMYVNEAFLSATRDINKKVIKVRDTSC